MTVYLIQHPPMNRKGWSPNTTSAAQYGPIRTCLSPSESASFDPGRAREKLQAKLADFNPKTDYILWAGGDPLALMLAGAVLYSMNHINVQYLRYERELDSQTRERTGNGYYTAIDVCFDHPELS